MLFEVAFFLFGAKLENRTLFKVARYVPDQVYVDKLLRGSRREQPDALSRRSNVASAKRFVPPTDPNVSFMRQDDSNEPSMIHSPSGFDFRKPL